MSGERVNLSSIILGHMQCCQSHDTHALPFPHVIKKLLSKLNLYPSDVTEKKVPKFLNMIVVRRLLVDEEEKVTAEAPRTSAMISVPNTAPQDALLSRIERIEQAILTARREQVQAILKVSQMQLETVQVAVSMNAEAHADT